MVREKTAARRRRAGGEQRSWASAHAELQSRDPAGLGPEQLEELADAAWWLCRVEESLEARQLAYSRFERAGDQERAAYNAWMLSTEHRMLGHAALSRGWQRKAQRHVQGSQACEELGYVVYGEAETAEAEGNLDAAMAAAARAIDVGRRCGSLDLIALGQQLQARLLVAGGHVDDGMALLDEAMCDVLAGHLGDLVTGWIYCTAVGACFEVADLARASEWNAAAMAWCASLPAGTPMHGLCRVHRVELLRLGGAWDEADREADRACDELLAYHPSFAAEAFYLAGEIRRGRGDLVAAEEAFRRAHQHGREPQPGLALLRARQGRVAEAVAALQSCLSSGDWGRLVRARLLAALVEVAVSAGDVDTAEFALAQLDQDGDLSAPQLLQALAAEAGGTVALARGDHTSGLERLRRARTLWLELDMPYEAAHARLGIASASQAIGDRDTADLELAAARAVLERLGSDDLHRIDGRRLDHPDPPAGLTPREVEVLGHVSAGRTNRDIADVLVISEHTVARHLNNIFTKLGVSSRAAATAFAYEHGLVDPRGPF